MDSRFDCAAVVNDLDTVGWHICNSVVAPDIVDVLCQQLGPAIERRRQIRFKNCVDGNNDGTVHHLLMDHPCYIEFLSHLHTLDEVFRGFFKGNYILNSYGGVCNEAGVTAYVHSVHRDIRFSADGKRFMLNLLVMLDEFTLLNGATHLLSSSQGMPDQPAAEDFREKSTRATGRRGSILLFDSRMWHATGENTTNEPRRALTLTLTSPFFKQQLDYPRLVGYENQASLSAYSRQIIGFNARVPATLEEYYVPSGQRFYQRGQDD